MIAEINVNNINYQTDLSSAIDISIPLQFNGVQPNLFNVALASSKAYEIGNFIGDTRLGGSCNFEEYRLVAHCNGTHTECVGHITYKRVSVFKTLKDSFLPAVLITVKPVGITDAGETYDPELNPEDLIITSESIKKGLAERDISFLKALIIRTLPNSDSKKSRRYIDDPPPFFSLEAMHYVASCPSEHLLVDIPTVDRTFDEGKMNNHRIYWDIQPGSHETNGKEHSHKTITEMIYVPDDVPDGEYFLNLQVAPFDSDAAPSRPVLYKIIK